eukprot:GFUD01016630.1.p1 GENE.GFUD01016630.1~~GFUD01016630.1.p1  ORF type:complete len:430 (-),score=35.45 GFUD01016630.1:169-1458(-)
MIDQDQEYTLDNSQIEKPELNSTWEVFDNKSFSENLLPNCHNGLKNDSGNCTEENDAEGYFYKFEQLTFLGVLLSVIIIGNSLVIVTLLSGRTRKSRMNFFIMHLAAADLSVGVFSVLTDIAWTLSVSWEAGLLACKIIKFGQLVVTYGSTYVLVAMSIDRYDAITHPMRFNRSWKRAKWLVVAAWVISVAFSVPILFFFNIHETEDYGTQCWIDFPAQWHWQLYMSLVALSLFIFPALIIAFCYTVIVITIWKKSKIMQPPLFTSAILPRVPLTEARRQRIALEDAENRRASSRGLIPKAKVKTVKMTFVIIFVFVLCWSPYIVFDLLQVFGLIPNTPTSIAAATFIQSLAPLNSAANPIIYCIFSANIGKYFRSSNCLSPCCKREDTFLSSSGQTTSSLLSSTNASNARYQNRRASEQTICAVPSAV